MSAKAGHVAAAPFITTTSLYVPTRGGLLTINGGSFGNSSSQITITYTNSSDSFSFDYTCALGAEGTSVAPDTIVCSVSGGTGKAYWVKVDVGPLGNIQTATSAQVDDRKFGYASPTISEPTGVPVKTTGGDITISGTNFGGHPEDITATFDNGRKCDVIIADHEYFVCAVPPGVGNNYTLSITVGPTNNSYDGLTSWLGYASPTISAVDPSPISTLGYTVSISGSGFGNASSEVSVVLVHNGAACVVKEPVDDSGFTCDAPAGTGSKLDIKITVGPTSNTNSVTSSTDQQRISYYGPVINSTTHDVLTAGQDITIIGSGFGDNATEVKVSYDGIECTVIPPVNDSMIVCHLTNNTGLSYTLVVEVGPTDHTQNSTAAEENADKFNFVQPKIDSIEPSNGVPATGGFITIYGNGFGYEEEDIIATIEGGVSCNVTLASDTYFVCQVPPGTGANYSVAIDVGPEGNRQSAVGDASYHYIVPTITGVSSDDNPVPTIGGDLTIFGDNFGLDYGNIKVTYGSDNITCTVSAVSNNTAVVCNTTAGIGAGYVITMIVGPEGKQQTAEHISKTYTVTFAKPTVDSVASGTDIDIGVDGTVITIPTSGAYITITGANFGLIKSNVNITLDNNTIICDLTDGILENDQIVCFVGPNTGRMHLISFMFGPPGFTQTGVINNGPYYISYPQATVTKIEGEPFATAGGSVLTITGDNFGVLKDDVIITIGSGDYKANCTIIEITDKSITCTVAAGSGENLALAITVGPPDHQEDADLGEFDDVDYEEPVIDYVGTTSTSGGALSISGSGFGLKISDITIKLPYGEGNLNCEPTEAADVYVICTMDAGTGKDWKFTVRVGPDNSHDQEDSAYFSFQAPSISDLTGIPLTVATGGILTITGSNFYGAENGEVTVEYGSNRRVCTLISAKENEIICQAEGGTGNNINFNVTVGPEGHEQLALNEEGFTIGYSPPHINVGDESPRGIMPPIARTTFGNALPPDTLTINGRNFGQNDSVASLDVMVAGWRCLNPIILDEFRIVCEIPEGTGTNNSVVVILNSARKKREESYTLYADIPFAYPPPNITELRYSEPIDTMGGTYITIVGWNFGPTTLPEDRVRTILIHGMECTDAVYDQTTVVCMVPHGTGKSNLVLPVIDTQNTQTQYKILDYAAPIVTDVLPAFNVDPKEPITIFGRYFGGLDPLAPRTVTIGGVTCTNVKMITDHKLTCYAHGVGVDQPVLVSVNGQSNDYRKAFTVDFTDAASPPLKCAPPSGAQDRFQTTLCNCWSGYAPSKPDYQDCDMHAICPPRYSTDLSIAHEFPPLRPETTFHDDALWVYQRVPIVSNRRGSNINFVWPKLPLYAKNGTAPGTEGMLTCGYPGVLWSKSVNQLDCVDEFRAQLPWSQHGLCGFAEDVKSSTPQYLIYKSDLVHTYYEIYFKENSRYKRTQQVTYLISVTFKRIVEVVTDQPFTVVLTDPNTDWLKVFVVGDSVYDAASESVFVTFRTTSLWPYALDVEKILGTEWRSSAIPAIMGEVAITNVVRDHSTAADVKCTLAQDTPCVQQWVATINTGGVCNIQGKFEMTDRVICRDVDESRLEENQPGGSCNFTGSGLEPEPALLSVKIGRTSLCADSPIDASEKLTYTLTSYFDSTFSEPQEVFQTGDMIFFTFDIQNPQATIDKVTFNQISIRAGSGDDAVVDEIYWVAEPRGAGSNLPSIDFVLIDEVRTSVSPNELGRLSFGFRLLRQQLDTVRKYVIVGSADESEPMTVEVTVDILYHGNQRRSMQIDRSIERDISTASISDAVVITVMDNTDSELAGDNNNDELGYNMDSSAASYLSYSVSLSVLIILLLGFVALLL